jgi:putative hydrolase of the HAD superfamily
MESIDRYTLPKAFLLDLDDTILNDTGSVQACWQEACRSAHEYGLDPGALLNTIDKTSKWFWSDAERHRIGRLNLRVARIEVARLALAELGLENSGGAEKIGGVYHDRREESLELLPGALDTLRWLRHQGCKLALVTNGNGDAQRRKISHFGLSKFFDAMFIEGDLGFGKPDERVYRLALDTLAISPGDAWMAGDNLEWDVAQPQKLGLFAVWINNSGNGLPKLGSIHPNLIIRALPDLQNIFSA